MVGKRPRVEHTDDWQEILPLCWWPEQACPAGYRICFT